jgi:hypothetical protein
MYWKNGFSYVVTGYIIAVGLFFMVSSLIDGTFLDLEPPASYFLVVLSIIFIGAGIYSIFLLNRGKLERSGKSITQVRQESIEGLKDQALLAKIALEDSNPEVRKAAENRLKDFKNH